MRHEIEMEVHQPYVLLAGIFAREEHCLELAELVVANVLLKQLPHQDVDAVERRVGVEIVLFKIVVCHARVPFTWPAGANGSSALAPGRDGPRLPTAVVNCRQS